MAIDYLEYKKNYVAKLSENGMRERQWLEFMTPFNRAGSLFFSAIKDGLTGEDLRIFLDEWLKTAENCEEILGVCYNAACNNEELLGDHAFSFEDAVILALSIAKSHHEVFVDVLMDCDCEVGSGLFDTAFDKCLALCQYKEDVEWLMGEICEWLSGSGDLDYERHFLKIFKRGHELPNRPEEPSEKDGVAID